MAAIHSIDKDVLVLDLTADSSDFVDLKVTGRTWSKVGLSKIDFKKKDAATQTEEAEIPKVTWQLCTNNECPCKSSNYPLSILSQRQTL